MSAIQSPSSSEPHASLPPLSTEARARAKIGFVRHATVYMLVIAVLIVINLSTSPRYLWFLWPAIGWGIGLAFHGFRAFHGAGPSQGSSLYKRIYERELERDRDRLNGS